MNAVLWNVGRAALKPLFLTIYRLRRKGRERIPRTGPVLVVCNHLSLRDPPMVGAAILPRPVRFMAKAELFRSRFVSWVLTGVGAFPVSRGGADRDAIRTAREILGRGECLVMFPEGTRSLTGKLRPFFPGAGMLALEPGVTVLPAAIWGSQHRLGPVTVAFGEPLDLTDLPAGSKSDRAREATRRMMAAVAQLVPVAGGPAQVVPDGEPTLERY